MPINHILGLILISWVMIFNREILESIHVVIYCYLSLESRMHRMDTNMFKPMSQLVTLHLEETATR